MTRVWPWVARARYEVLALAVGLAEAQVDEKRKRLEAAWGEVQSLRNTVATQQGEIQLLRNEVSALGVKAKGG